MSNNKIVFKGKTDAIYKIIVIGDPATGKTELIAKFATNQFEEKYLPTVGVSLLKESIELKAYNATVNLMFWDIAGQSQFYMLHRPYFNGADGMLLVFDITRSSTFSNIDNWYSVAVKYGLSGIPRILIGNKAHLTEERKIILPMAEHLAEKLNAPYYETSPLTGENVKEVFEKIAELVYLAPKREDASNNEPLISKNYEEPSNDKHRVEKSSHKTEKPLDWKLVLLKEVQPSSSVGNSKEKEDDLTIEMDEREKRALETVFRHFKGSRRGKSQSEPMSPKELRELIILSSKYKLQTILAFIYGFVFIYLFWFLTFFTYPMIEDEIVYKLRGFEFFEFQGLGARILLISCIVLTVGIGGRLITFAFTLRHFFIFLHYSGIYYKKIGKPRFIPWADIVWIEGYMRTFQGRPTVRAVKIHLKSNKKVRFNSSNYLFKDKFLDFDDVFISYQFRRCPFYSLDNFPRRN